ncbi:DUF3298 and DUF4163 domain-containing protein [Parapedobacter koreensis]|uniref:DUF3298 domain-containing protein n=1 Tax=Parapedobacter koreensis TaxID=332977 RepID=A0A1H7TQV7_9SPHI|nr:DUF3298 and DUF4163 domain-containing protein [Parapedobacter koreensis]SEL87068.1 protein of unknown function [Parapedobacter koreensis]
MKRSNISIFYIVVATLLGACQSNTETQESTGNKVALDTLEYNDEDYVRYSDNLVKTSETTDTTYFAVSYPKFQDTVVNRFVLSALLGSDTATVAGAAQTFIKEFDDFHQSDPFPRIWTSESHAKVYRITPSYLELVIDASTYTGGAHGNYATVFVHYDLTDQSVLVLDDIVARAFRNELTAIAERYFREQENLAVDQSLDDQYFFDQGRFSIPDNFALERDSMLFLYNIYEIKPYVEGQTELRVPYSEIERLLTDRAKRIIGELTMQNL